jgi:peptidoglycan/xylan/chitin deacetylase (PgdA/CDA1 family)
MSVLNDQLPILLPLAGGAVAFGALALVSAAPRCGVWGNVISRGQGSDTPQVALTFDDGPTVGSTDRVLDALAELHAPAAFFVIGSNARTHPDLVRRMHDEGHLVANHSLHHSHYGCFRSTRYWHDEIHQTRQIIHDIIGLQTALFRPPMGVKTWCITGAARRCGHSVVTWTRRGFDGISTTPQKICRRLSQHAHPGDVLMLHDGVEPNSRRDPSATVAAIVPLIQDLRHRGLEIVRLDQLLAIHGYAGPTT